MTANPWLKFYPRDWRGDQALRSVSMAARGLWIECLCIMHEAKPYGHLLLNGEPVEGEALARMAGTSVDEVSALVTELRKAGVLSMTSKGVVFSRRMTRDHARAQKGQKSAKKRWSQASDGVEQSEAPNRSPNRIPITQKPEARNQKLAAAREADASELQRLCRILGLDETDWRSHARNLETLIRLKADGCDFERHIIPAAMQAAKSGRAKTLNYLRPRAEELRDAERTVATLPVPFEPTDMQGWRDRVRVLIEHGLWHAKNGPKPGEAGCMVPSEILAEFNLLGEVAA